MSLTYLLAKLYIFTLWIGNLGNVKLELEGKLFRNFRNIRILVNLKKQQKISWLDYDTWHVFLLTLGIMEDDMIHRVRVQVRDNRLVGHLVKKASVWSKHNCTKWGRYHLAEEWHSGLLNAICSVESFDCCAWPISGGCSFWVTKKKKPFSIWPFCHH